MTTNVGTSLVPVSNDRGLDAVSKAQATQAQAAVQARYAIANQFPRSLDNVRIRLLGACKRPGFAESAIYRKPVGKDRQGNPTYVEGLSIRFAEEAVRHIGNLAVETFAVYDDGIRRITRVSVTDLESNTVYISDIPLEKTVERKKARAGVISERVNSYGDTVYIVQATEEEFRTKEAAEVSKAIRNNVLRLLPGDIQAECRAAIYSTIESGAKEDPNAAKNKILDSFAGLNVLPSDLAEYLGHNVDKASPREIAELRGLFAAIRDGETSWIEIMEEREEEIAKRSKKEQQIVDIKEAKEAVSKAAKEAKASADAPAVDGPGTATPSEFWTAATKAKMRASAAKAFLQENFGSEDPRDLSAEQIADAINMLPRAEGGAQ